MRRILVALVLVWCVGCTLYGLYHHLARAAVPMDIACWRAAARSLPHAASVSVVNEDLSLDAVARSRLIAVNWEISPRVAQCATPASATADYLLASAFLSPDECTALLRQGYALYATNALASVWSRGAVAFPRATAPSAAAACRYGGLRPPNGLGVYAGKAKLMLLNRGIPPGFWTDPAYAVYQPSYPPGMTLLAMAVFAASGISDAGMISCVVPTALLAIFLALTWGTRNPWLYVLAALYVACPLALRLGAGFYAEPFAVLCIILGGRLCARGHGNLGWWIVGCAALFRHEALILVGLMWLVSRLQRREATEPWWNGIWVCVPGLCWQLLTWTVGAHVYDYDFASLPRLGGICTAFGALLSLLSTRAGEIGGGLLLIALAGFGWNLRGALAASVTFLLICILLLGFNTSPQFVWIVKFSLPRIAWLASAPLLLALLHTSSVGIVKRKQCWYNFHQQKS